MAVAEEFAHVINTELKALVDAGARFIQIDEPARGNVTGAEMARLFNLATEGVEAKLAFHICFAIASAGHGSSATTATTFPAPWKPEPISSCSSMPAVRWPRSKCGRSGATVGNWGAGIIDVKSFHPESAEEVAARLRQVLKYADADKGVHQS